MSLCRLDLLSSILRSNIPTHPGGEMQKVFLRPVSVFLEKEIEDTLIR